MRLLVLRIGLIFLTLLTAPVVLHAQREKLSEEDLAIVEQNFPTAKNTSMGIRYIVQQEGTGEKPVPGDLVSVLYAGRLLDGTVFDKANDPEHPFVFRVGRDMVIRGWDFMLPLMRVGERRVIIVPPEFGYGTRGSPPKIPRNATLVFVIQLISIKRD